MFGGIVMDRIGVIFDCDGTLIDSMDAWRNLEGELGHRAGVELTAEDSVLRELLIVKIRSNAKLIPEITDITTIFKAKTIDISDASMTLELTGRGAKLDSFLRLLAPYGILEMARSGASALQRGEECLGEQK